MRLLRILALISLYFMLEVAVCSAQTTYTVKTGGGGNYTTIQACATAMAAGDTCVVYAGTYNENVTLSSGTSGHLKTLTVNTGDTVNVLSFSINSYDVINGFHIQNTSSPTAHACVSVNGGATTYYVQNNNMYACNSAVVEATSANTTFGYITGNTISYMCSTSSAPNVCRAMTINGDYHLIDSNNISHVADGPYVFGKYNVLRNNVFGPTTDNDCGSNSGNCHIDFMQADSNVPGGGQPAQYLLMEGNTVQNMAITGSFAGSGAHAGPLLQAEACSSQCFNAILRFHVADHISGGGITDDNSGTTPPPQAWINVKAYNNSWVDMLNTNSGSGPEVNPHSHGSYGGSNLNEIYYLPHNGAGNGTNPYDCQDTACSPYYYGHSLAYCAGSTPCTLYGHAYGSGAFTADPGNISVDPLFVNYAANDLHLQSGSPALNAGTNLTTVNGSVTSSTTLVVADAGYFQAANPLVGVESDCISVTSVSNHVCITAINYSTNTLTLASPITATNGAPVWLYSDSNGTVRLTGTAPNMGALGTSGGTTYSLTISTAGTGTGSVSGTNCTTGSYASGTTIGPCTANPASGSTFTGWTSSGSAPCPGLGTCGPFSLISTTAITANFSVTAATPTFSLSGNRVSITTTTPSATIYYTVDGSTPTPASQVYSHPLLTLRNVTYKAIAAAAGFSNSAVGSQNYTPTAQKTVFSLTPTSSSSSPVPYPPDLRACCGSNVAALEATRGTYTLTVLHNWITAATSNGSTFTYTIQGFPAWMTGLSATESAPPSDLHTSAACQNVLTGTITTDCSMKEFVTKLMMDRTGLSSQPSTPVTCANLDYLEIINEFNTDSPSGSSTGWTGTYADLATLGNDISTITHAWCSNTVVIGGSASAIVGFHSNGADGHYDVALKTLLQDWAGILNPSLPDAISVHLYPSRNNIIEMPMPTTIVSHSDATCTPGNTPNSSCYIAVKDEVNQLNTTATLQNSSIVSWAKNLPIYSTEGGFGEVSQLGGTSTTTIGASYVAESMMAIAAQNPVNHMFYAADDPTWGCYWDCGSGTSAWLFAFNQMSTWLGAHSITGPLASSSITGGTKWTLPLDSGAAELDFCDAWLASCTTTTSFNTQTTLANATSPTGGSLTLTQEPVLLFNSGVVATPTFSPVAGTYASTQTITISTTTSGATICYTTDGSTPTTDGAGTCTHGTTYSTPVSVSSSLTLKAVGSKSGDLDSGVGSAAYVINGAVATPTFSPVAGTYVTAQTVTISTATSGATLCYTTDGSTPTANGAGTCTHGTTYSGPVSVSSSLTLKAMGSKNLFTDSSVGSAAYVINLVAAPVNLSGKITISGGTTIQ